MEKALHIVFGDCSRGLLTHYFRDRGLDTENDILCFKDSLSRGTIFNDFSQGELHKRAKLILQLYGKTWYQLDEEEIYQDLIGFLQFDFSHYSKIVIWHGNIVDEQMMLYLTCALLPDRELYEADITLVHGYKPTVRALFVCSPKELDFLFPQIAPISSKRKIAYIATWQKQCESEADLRIWENDAVTEVPIDYYDELILSFCTEEFKSPARIVGESLAACDQHIGDSFFYERLLYLAEQYTLSVRANPAKRIVQGIDVTYPTLYQVKLAGKSESDF